MQYRSSREALAEVYGGLWADSIIATLDRAGYIIVDKGAIGRAQREAVALYEEDRRELERCRIISARQ